jgi:hypothetical protein
MSNNKNVWMWTTAVLLCTNIAVGYLYINENVQLKKLRSEYVTLEQAIADAQGSLEELTITVNIKIDNGEDVNWFNSTRIPINSNLLEATEYIADLEYTIGEYGAFITSLNGTGGDANMFWVWNYFEKGSWEYGPVAADSYTLSDGDTIAWVYTSF